MFMHSITDNGGIKMEKITVKESGERLDNYLSKYLEITRSQIKKNIDNIYVNDKNEKSIFKNK